MSENPQPSTPRNVRHRVAMPIESSRTNTPSLIPLDVLQDVQREVNAKVRDDAEREPRTAPLPVPDEVGVFTEVTANVEVAIKALSQVSLFSNLPRASLEAMERRGDRSRGAAAGRSRWSGERA